MIEDMRQKVRDFFTTRKQSYCLTFDGIHGERVLADLAKFCRAHETTHHENKELSAMLDGRREVWLRIQTQLNLSEEQIWELYNVAE